MRDLSRMMFGFRNQTGIIVGRRLTHIVIITSTRRNRTANYIIPDTINNIINIIFNEIIFFSIKSIIMNNFKYIIDCINSFLIHQYYVPKSNVGTCFSVTSMFNIYMYNIVSFRK